MDVPYVLYSGYKLSPIFVQVVLFVATVVGCHAHFNNAFKDAWDMDGYPELCKLVDTCPKSAMPMEKTFVALTIICLILSTISLVAGFLMDMKKFKGPVSKFVKVSYIHKFEMPHNDTFLN